MNSQRSDFRSFTLDNGMRVNLVVNRSAPLAEVHFYVRTGYAWESDRLQGVSHVVEHNLLQASATRPTRLHFARDRRGMGGWYDAGTSYDYTEYLMVVPRDHLRAAMELLADGFFSPVFRREVFTSEMGAILQESRRKEDIPEPMVMEKLYSAAYLVHRRRRWRLGTEESLSRLTVEDLMAYFKQRYGPANMVCTVGGDIDLDEAETLVRAIISPIRGDGVQGENSPAEPPQDGVRYLEIPSDRERVYWICGFHTPEFLINDGYHYFDLLAAVLGGGRGSRLITRVQNKGLVDRIEARSTEHDEYRLFNVYAETDAGRLPEAERAILTELFALGMVPVSDTELAKARTMLSSSILMKKDDLKAHLEWLAVFEGRGGDVRGIDSYAGALADATPADLCAAAAAHFTPRNLTICMLRPPHGAVRDRAAVAETAETAYARAGELPPFEVRGVETPLPVALSIASGILHRPEPPVRFDLANHASAVFRKTPGNPVFAAAAMVKGGRVLENTHTCGLTDLLVAVMAGGTARMNEATLATALEELGMRMTPVIAEDGFGFTVYGPGQALRRGLAILSEVLLAPAVDKEVVARQKQRLIHRIASLQDRPREYSLALFQRELFRNHPYGLPWPGDPAVIESLEQDNLAAWHRRLLAGR
ncbi:insulinase family protein, partial [bacterium]|nr:insulinase family protein [candidate division CSSED10-310 bacterium]